MAVFGPRWNLGVTVSAEPNWVNGDDIARGLVDFDRDENESDAYRDEDADRDR